LLAGNSRDSFVIPPESGADLLLCCHGFCGFFWFLSDGGIASDKLKNSRGRLVVK